MNYLAYRPDYREIVERYKGNLGYDLGYQIIMARMHYMRSPLPIPETPMGIARYYKEIWNTEEGAAVVKEAFRNYVFLGV